MLIVGLHIDCQRWLLIVFFLIHPFFLFCQTYQTPYEQQLENITANNNDAEIEDDSYTQQLQQFLKNSININIADYDILAELKMLTPIQIQSLLSYRKLFGKFINIYELQAIPNWDLTTIQKIIPFINININEPLYSLLKERLHDGENSVLARVSQIAEKSKGYIIDSNISSNYYLGSAQKLLIRYKYQFKNLLQYGFLGEKDAGEQFFRGQQKKGFDFYSAHFFVKNIGIIKSLALGDFTVNLGQGLTQWQNLAFKKSADVINIKREDAIIHPYNSVGEINFHRGIGITILKNNWQATTFLSYKKIDANLIVDSASSSTDYISSLQTSGYHRTYGELADKHIQQQIVFGGNVSYQCSHYHIGINLVQYHFSKPIIKDNVPYNLYAINGNKLGNTSIDYSYTFKNLHLFGEAAIDNNFYKAFINGILISMSSNIDMSFLYRNISSGYQTLYTTAFTENTFPNNEKGFYSGISIRPNNFWRIDAYADFYKFPWIKYGVNSPSNGADYLLQVTYKPNKQLEINGRFHTETKAYNFNIFNTVLTPVINQPKQNLRLQFNYKINPTITIRNRTEIVWINQLKEQGYLFYVDILYNSFKKPWGGSVRVQYFETDSYNTRLYAYENDVLFSYSIPVIYDKGIRYYVNLNYNINKRMAIWAKISQSIYKDKNSIGSGLDAIQGNKKSEYKIEILYNF